jgi:hypothetical protein
VTVGAAAPDAAAGGAISGRISSITDDPDIGMEVEKGVRFCSSLSGQKRMKRPMFHQKDWPSGCVSQ